MGREKRINANATEDREKSLTAKREAACFGYDSGIYTNIHWKVMNTVPAYIRIPVALTIQLIEALEVHAE